MTDRSTEDDMPISPEPRSPVPEIFSSKKMFFLSSSCSESRRSEIPHIESDYCPRDEVSRRLFHHGGDSCDCDCSSDGCCGCLRRSKQCLFKFFVLALSIALILLLFGSLSYNLTRNKGANESYELDRTEWVSHYHEYPAQEEGYSRAREDASAEPVLDLPVPVYEHLEDYDSSEDLQKLRYRLNENAPPEAEHVEPISPPSLNKHRADSRGEVPIIGDGREPTRARRSPSTGAASPRSKRDSATDNEFLLEELNEIEEGMEKFWEIYFKRGKTVFEPFSLTTPRYSTTVQGNRVSSQDGEVELGSEDVSSSGGPPHPFAEATAEGGQEVDRPGPSTTDTNSGLLRTSTKDKTAVTESQRIVFSAKDYESIMPASQKESDDKPTTRDDVAFVEINGGFPEGVAPEAVAEEKSTSRQEIDSSKEKQNKESRTWPLFHFSVPIAGVFGSSQQDRISAEPAPVDTVKGISLADAKKIKKERRKHMLLNSRVVGGSSDVRLPTAPDVSKPFVNAFETLKTNQQLSFSPSAASQFVLPYQMCLFAGPFPGNRPPLHAAQPRTFSFAAPFAPPLLDKDFPPKDPHRPPAQQNILSFSINNYPNVLAPRPPSGASGLGFSAPHRPSPFPGPPRQPVFCTYLQPPLFQFPTVPGTADFSRAKCVDCPDDSPRSASPAEESVSPSGREILCPGDKVSCVDGSGCVPVGNWCDNRVHCSDASDEAFCSCRDRVARDRICDGYVDCPHGEDETGCFDCPKSAFSCDSVITPGSCIPLSKRCDGIRDCATGADEADCSALFFHVRQNDSYETSQAAGFLHRNWKGAWFPVCVDVGEGAWAEEACAGELGVLSSVVEVRFASVSAQYKGPFIVREEDGTAALQDHCKGHVSTYVKCPPVSCGTRIEHRGLREMETRYPRDELGRDAPGGFRRGRAASNGGKSQAGGSGAARTKREETGRVVGGRESRPRAWPWAIAVYKNGAFHCGGVILDEKWVLTAAHCMEQYWKHYYEVRGGMLRRFSFSAMEQARSVSHVVIHENYDLTIMSNDLALLRLQEPFHFNRWVRPACLPVLQDGVSEFLSGPAPGTRCTAVGWGALKERGTDPDQLREVEIPIMVKCKHKEDLVGEEICAGKAEGGKDTCQGDSGGPLLCRDSGVPASWYVAGIVSHGEGCARPGEPGAYTRISLFVDWITANANDFQLPSVRPLKSCPGFRCRSASRLCIPRKWVCNGYTDCLEAEDEKNCTSDSAASNIFNHPYWSEYKYSEEAAAQKSVKESSIEFSATSEFGFSTTAQMEQEDGKFRERTKETEPPSEGISSVDKTERFVPGEEAERTTPGFGIPFSTHAEHTSPVTPSGMTRAPTPVTSASPENEKRVLGETFEKSTLGISELEASHWGEGLPTTSPVPATSKSVKKETPLYKSYEPSKKVEYNEEKEVTAVDMEGERQTGRNNKTEKVGEDGNKGGAEADKQEEMLQNQTEGVNVEKDESRSEAAVKITEDSREFEQEKGLGERKTDIQQNEKEYKEGENSDEDFEEEGSLGGIEYYAETEIQRRGSKVEKENKEKGGESHAEKEYEDVRGEEKFADEDGEEEHTSPGVSAKMRENWAATDSTANAIEGDARTFSRTAGESEAETSPKGRDEGRGNSEDEVGRTKPDVAETTLPVTTEAAARGFRTPVPDESLGATGTSSSAEDFENGAVAPLHLEALESGHRSLASEGDAASGFLSPAALPGGRNSEAGARYFQCRQIVQSIVASHRCDGFEDCEDGTDEENCFCAQALLDSDPELLCNGRIDCPDASDEKNCSECRGGEFHCRDSARCISLQDRCDGTAHCRFGEDETKCLALAKSGELRFQESGEPFLETEGVLAVNRNGVWTLKCQEEGPAFAAGDAIEVCSSLGTIGYERYQNRSLGLNCTGFHVTCARMLSSSADRYRNPNGGYLWPWNAFVYSDGKPACTAVLLRPGWLLTSSHCLRGFSFEKNYLVAKLGARSFSATTEEAGVRTVRVDGARLVPDSDVALLHLSEEVDQTESVRPLGIPYAFHSDPEKDACVAVGDRTLFLKIRDECPETCRCFGKTGSTPSGCRSQPWIGVVVCQSRFGWYPASVFSEKAGHCGFERSNFTDLREKLKSVYFALEKKTDVFPEPVCSGYRCLQGRCIPRSQVCNGWPDCASAEDESFELCKSNREMKECAITELRCRNGRCIPKVLFGDGNDDCGDESDEPLNKTCAEYLRLTTPRRICDGKRNCHDKTDEDYNLCPCDGDKFRCKPSGYCVPKDFVCDGEKDCPGGEDEEQCLGRKIVKNHAKTHLEILQKSYGIWHTVCYHRISKQLSDSLCRDLGFKEALVAFDRNQTVLVPEIDGFSWVKLNRKTGIALRGSKPFVKLLPFSRTCSSIRCA